MITFFVPVTAVTSPILELRKTVFVNEVWESDSKSHRARGRGAARKGKPQQASSNQGKSTAVCTDLQYAPLIPKPVVLMQKKTPAGTAMVSAGFSFSSHSAI